MIAKLWRRFLRGLQNVQAADSWRAEYKYWAKREGTLSLKDELFSWKYKFIPGTQDMYDYAAFPREDFLSDRRRYLYTTKINGDYNTILTDKLVFHRALHAWQAYLPPLYGFYSNGQFRPEQQGPVAIDDYIAALMQDETFKGLVLKPHRGSLGKGILFLQRKEDGCLYCKGRALDVAALPQFFQDRLKGTYIVEGLLTQAAYARNIFPDSANTIRVLVMRDPTDGQFFIARAIHRFGNSQTDQVDNFAAGGYAVAIDLDTGRMGKAARLEGRGLSWYSHHTETEARIEGEVIPNWSGVCEAVLRLSADLPFLNYIGWDVLVRDDGFNHDESKHDRPSVFFVEGNGHSSIDLFQIHRPLLSDPRIQRFYKHYGVI